MTILIPPLSPGVAAHQPRPRIIGPAQDPEIRNQTSMEIPVPNADGEHVTVFYSTVPSPGGEMRNPGAEALIGHEHPAYGPAIVTSGDMEHMSREAVDFVLRVATPNRKDPS